MLHPGVETINLKQHKSRDIWLCRRLPYGTTITRSFLEWEGREFHARDVLHHESLAKLRELGAIRRNSLEEMGQMVLK